jgi:hypothetical protein
MGRKGVSKRKTKKASSASTPSSSGASMSAERPLMKAVIEDDKANATARTGKKQKKG